MINSIYFRRKSKVLLPLSSSRTIAVDVQYVATLIKELNCMGYMPTPRLFDQLQLISEKEFESFYLSIIPVIKQSLGVKEYRPMYPNFPAQVMEMDHVDLFINAIIHYWTLALPIYEKKERLPLFEDCEVKPLDLGTEEEFYNIFRNLMGATASLSATENEDLKWLFDNEFDKISNCIPPAIPFKETLVLISNLCHENNQMDKVSHLYRTATDVLRLAVALSDGDVTLSENTKFIKFKRKTRKLLLSLLDQTTNTTEDMWRYRGNWIRLGEILHPGEYSNKFTNAFASFEVIRNQDKYRTFNSKVESAITSHDLSHILTLVRTRPGEFARRLDHLLREFPTMSAAIMVTFESVIPKVATRVLLQLKAFFGDRNEIKRRFFIIKSTKLKSKIIDNTLPTIENAVCKSVIEVCDVELQRRFSDLPNLGKVYFDPKLYDYNVPLVLRTASKALKSVPMGSKIALPDDKNFIRFFLWWKDGDSRTDIDLTTPFYTDDWKYIDHISYTKLKSTKLNACHSGDITSAPNGASEFIDVDIEKAKAAGARYIIMSIYSYSGQSYSDLPECFAGIMTRKSQKSGEIYDPRTVGHKFDLSANTKVAIPMVIDLVERKVIWLDFALNKQFNLNNIECSAGSIQELCSALIERSLPNLGDLLDLHITARKGTLVENIDDANVIFTTDSKVTNEKATVITPYDMDVILAEYVSG